MGQGAQSLGGLLTYDQSALEEGKMLASILAPPSLDSVLDVVV